MQKFQGRLDIQQPLQQFLEIRKGKDSKKIADGIKHLFETIKANRGTTPISLLGTMGHPYMVLGTLFRALDIYYVDHNYKHDLLGIFRKNITENGTFSSDPLFVASRGNSEYVNNSMIQYYHENGTAPKMLVVSTGGGRPINMSPNTILDYSLCMKLGLETQEKCRYRIVGMLKQKVGIHFDAYTCYGGRWYHRNDSSVQEVKTFDTSNITHLTLELID